MLALGTVFMVTTFVVFVVYGVCAATLRHVVGRPQVTRRLRQVFSLSFVALGATRVEALLRCRTPTRRNAS